MNQIHGVPDDPDKLPLQSVTDSFWIPVTGMSMRPLLREGDAVKVEPKAKEELLQLKSGTLIAYIQPGTKQIVIHRLVGVNGPFLLERGDHARKTREIAVNNVIGVVTLRNRNGIFSSNLGLPVKFKLRRIIEKFVESK